jgi:hypothetical protein
MRRTHDWRDNVALFTGDVERVPNSVRLIRNLGTIHWEANEWSDAAGHFRHALLHWPEHSETHGDLAYAMDQVWCDNFSTGIRCNITQGGVNASGVVQEYLAALQGKPDKYAKPPFLHYIIVNFFWSGTSTTIGLRLRG